MAALLYAPAHGDQVTMPMKQPIRRVMEEKNGSNRRKNVELKTKLLKPDRFELKTEFYQPYVDVAEKRCTNICGIDGEEMVN